MTSPAAPRRASHVLEDGHYHSGLHTRTGALTHLMRTRSQQNLAGGAPPRTPSRTRRHYGSDDEESLRGRSRSRQAEDDDIERLLRDETRLSQILHGPQNRSMNLLGKSNPRYRWERYWKSDDELYGMSKPM